MGRTDVASAGDRNALGHPPGTEPGSCRGRILKWTGLFWCLKGYLGHFGVYRDILGCITQHRERGLQGKILGWTQMFWCLKGYFRVCRSI